MHQTPVSNLALAVALLLLPACTQAIAEAPQVAAKPEVEGAPAPVEIPDVFRKQIHNNKAAFLLGRINDLYRYSPTGTVTAEDVTLVRQVDLARRRAQAMTQYLAFDLNGDGAVTREEFERLPASVVNRGKPQLDLAFATSDPNSDGKLDPSELIAIASAEAEQQATRRRSYDDSPMMFDRNGDGKVDTKEVTEVVDAIAAEPEPVRTRAGREAKPACVLPAASKDAEVVIVSGYEGGALSSVAVNGFDEETTVATLKIEKGTRPLYIFANTYDTVVWQITGDTARVERFVAQPRNSEHGPGTGVVGLPATKVSFSGPSACGGYASTSEGRKADRLKATVGGALRRPVDTLVASYTLSGMSLPSGVEPKEAKDSYGPAVTVKGGRYYLRKDGKPEFVSNKMARRTEWAMSRFYPGGVIEFEPKDVVANAPVQTYDVLPAQAGLLQLLKSGALSTGPDGEYIIEKPITRFPSGLYGAHSVKFVLKKGVPMPAGNPGHSAVLREDTGECTGALCRSDDDDE